jgi:RNA polymerase primary sigma factor
METSKNSSLIEKNHSLVKYFGEISAIPLLKAAEEVELAAKIRSGNRKALSKMILANLRFVVRVSYEYRNQGLPLGDLINEGNLGLIKAAHRFDETKGFKFISYAVWWIKQSILQALADNARLVRLPLNKVNTINRIGKTFTSLEQEFERTPTLDEIAGSLDISSDDVTLALQYPGKHLSLDASLNESDTVSLLEVTKNSAQTAPDHSISNESLKEEIQRALESLNEKEAEILQLYFGLDMERPFTLEEIGKKYRITRERVRQIKEKAIIRLRHQSRSKSLRKYLG